MNISGHNEELDARLDRLINELQEYIEDLEESRKPVKPEPVRIVVGDVHPLPGLPKLGTSFSIHFYGTEKEQALSAHAFRKSVAKAVGNINNGSMENNGR